MAIVVDANVFKAYFEKSVLGIDESLTGCPIAVFEKNLPIYIDESEHIEYEWKALVDPDWLESWLAHQLSTGAINMISVSNRKQLCKGVYALGFPKSKDIWYLRTAKEIAEVLSCNGTIITEDIDFFDPKNKSLKSSARVRLLKSRNPALKKHLRNNESIDILCVSDSNKINEKINMTPIFKK